MDLQKPIKLGMDVTDPLTGFSGTVIAKVEYLYQRTRFEVQPNALHDGSPIKAEWFDGGRLMDVR